MEGPPCAKRTWLSSFPRATRGWKIDRQVLGVSRKVSPALRGDGRKDADPREAARLFPPRYAGMEGSPRSSRCVCRGFPRATRGWKGNVLWRLGCYSVSPALRGDGRISEFLRMARHAFPPRYAGMEGRGLRRTFAGQCFPRATRGWKVVSVVYTPLLRGWRCGWSLIWIVQVVPPRIAGMVVMPTQCARQKIERATGALLV